MSILTQPSKAIPVTLSSHPLIYPANYQTYLYSPSEATTDPINGNIDIPLVIDTEFKSVQWSWMEGQSPRKHLTTQIQGIHETTGSIYVNPEYSGLTKWKDLKTEFHPLDHLSNRGYQVSISKATKAELNGLYRCRFVLYAHFALAEFLMIVSGDLKTEMIEVAKNKRVYGKKIEMKRHLNTYTEQNRNGHKRTLPYVDLPYIITLNGEKYALSITYHDTVAIHGQASYKELCSNVGIELKFKDNFTSEEKSRMDQMMLERTQDFEEYALGDLEVYRILVNNSEKFKDVYNLLSVGDRFQAPRKTIGATVKDVFTAKLSDALEIDRKQFNILQSKILYKTSASGLKEDVKSTICLLSKVNGGRCRNNRPLDIYVNKPLADIDISGCYGEGQRVQSYPIGNPIKLSFPIDSDVNDYWTLEQFLKVFQDELVPGLWSARVSFEGSLKYKQDFFISWFLPNGYGENIMAKYLSKMSNDTEENEVDLEFDEEDGTLKILQNEIHNAILTHDDLQWILNVASTRQRKELMSGLRVKAAIVYPKSKQVRDFEHLNKALENHNQKNTVEWKGRGKNKRLHYKDGECHAWFALNMGDLIIDDLLFNRKQYPKKTPLNTLFKLCVNTLYGDMTSKYFDCANTVVGNNITARARALAWYMEKGFNGFQTITDGCTFELNGVVYPRREGDFNASYLVDVYNDNIKGNIRLAPLGGYDSIELDYEDHTPFLTLIRGDSRDVKRGYEALAWIDKTAMIHLQTLFPGVDILHNNSTSIKAEQTSNGWVKKYTERKGQFEFETKSIYHGGIFHGTSNYSLLDSRYPEPCAKNVKMRSYETKKPHVSICGDDTDYRESNRYDDQNNPAIDLLTQLKNNPTTLTRQPPFIKTGLVKLGDYVNRLETFETMGLEPGDNFYKSGMLREFSLSQFTFKTFEQWRAWEKRHTRLKEKYGQSFEMFFMNADGTLDYQAMIKDIDTKIKSQPLDLTERDYDPMKLFDGHRNRYRELEDKMGHPDYFLRVKIAEMLKLEPLD